MQGIGERNKARSQVHKWKHPRKSLRVIGGEYANGFEPEAPPSYSYVTFRAKFKKLTTRRRHRRTFLSVVREWQLYPQALIFMSSSVPTYALKFTLPQIIRNMGFSNNQAQLLTVPPYFLGAFSAVFSSMLADKLRWRYPFICGPQMLLCISYAVLFVYAANIRANVALCYTFVNISTIASYPIVPGGNTWTLNNLAGQEKRAMGIAFMITMGNLGGIVGSFIFRDDEKPRYPTGWGACLGFVVAGVVSATLLELGYFTINKRRARKSEDEVRAEYTDEKLESMGNKSPLFRYSL